MVKDPMGAQNIDIYLHKSDYIPYIGLSENVTLKNRHHV